VRCSRPRLPGDRHPHDPEVPAPRRGFELVQKQIENAMRLRDAVDEHPLLSKYMRCLTTADLIPAEHRPTGLGRPGPASVSHGAVRHR
jgi:hypothetical protein